MIAFALACSGPAEDSGTPWEADELDALPLPDFSDVDLSQAASEALTWTVALDLSPAWDAHVQSLQTRSEGCPDVYVGPPPDADMMDEGGMSWSDTCRTAAGRQYGGWAWWETDLSSTAGTEGRRALSGRAAIAEGGDLELYLRGSGEEAFVLSGEEGARHWQRNTTLDWSVEGTLAAGLPDGGVRTDLTTQVTGGDVVHALTASGNAYLPEHRIADRFDSFEVNLELQGEQGAAPDDCTLEPRGYIGLRDPDAHWVHLVFLPLEQDGDTGEPDPRSVCDGCATVYVRGVEQDDPVCLDFSSIWTSIPEPDPSDYVLSLRDPGGAG